MPLLATREELIAKPVKPDVFLSTFGKDSVDLRGSSQELDKPPHPWVNVRS